MNRSGCHSVYSSHCLHVFRMYTVYSLYVLYLDGVHIGATWRITSERYMYSSDVALCQITVTLVHL